MPGCGCQLSAFGKETPRMFSGVASALSGHEAVKLAAADGVVVGACESGCDSTHRESANWGAKYPKIGRASRLLLLHCYGQTISCVLSKSQSLGSCPLLTAVLAGFPVLQRRSLPDSLSLPLHCHCCCRPFTTGTDQFFSSRPRGALGRSRKGRAGFI